MGGIQLALNRWQREPWFYRDRVFRGRVLDLGGSGDPFKNVAHLFPNVTEVLTVDESPGADIVADLDEWRPDESMADCIVSSHTLEHLWKPALAVSKWTMALSPGGYMLIIVPGWRTYEREKWPPHVNSDHKKAWVLDEDQLYGEHLEPLIDMRNTELRLVRALTLDEGWQRDAGDQTANGTCECGLEAVWQRI